MGLPRGDRRQRREPAAEDRGPPSRLHDDPRGASSGAKRPDGRMGPSTSTTRASRRGAIMSQGHFLFDAGHVIRTPLALLALVSTHVSEWSLLERHQSGDFGDIDTTMRASNAGSMKHGGVIFSSYQLSNGCA